MGSPLGPLHVLTLFIGEARDKGRRSPHGWDRDDERAGPRVQARPVRLLSPHEDFGLLRGFVRSTSRNP